MTALTDYLCTRDDVPPGGCTDTQPCICLHIQASVAVATAARELIKARNEWTTVPGRLFGRFEALEAALANADRLGL